MLPFLKRSQEASSSGPVESVTREPDYEDDSEFDSLEIAAQELLDAIDKKDVKAMATAIRAAIELCDSEPHTEGPHNG